MLTNRVSPPLAGSLTACSAVALRDRVAGVVGVIALARNVDATVLQFVLVRNVVDERALRHGLRCGKTSAKFCMAARNRGASRSWSRITSTECRVNARASPCAPPATESTARRTRRQQICSTQSHRATFRLYQFRLPACRPHDRSSTESLLLSKPHASARRHTITLLRYSLIGTEPAGSTRTAISLRFHC